MRNATSVGLSKTFSGAPADSGSLSSKSASRVEFLRKVAALLGRPIPTSDPEENS
jgi:hypothetical protein